MRYAIYFMPPADDPLWHFGSAILGYDAATGVETGPPKFPAFAGLPMGEWTREPRRYGFHATLKPPFYLRDGCSEQQLLAHARAFAASRRVFVDPPLRLSQLGGFHALVLSQPSPALHALADDSVREFDRFRAPLTEHDRHRRLLRPFSARQLDYLERWGYPHVFEEFIFHMTLSGWLAEPERQRLAAPLAEIYAGVAAPLVFDAITVFVQPRGRDWFHVLERCVFGDVLPQKPV